jgi:hypothetical protein
MKVKTKDELIELYVKVVNKLINIPIHSCNMRYDDYEDSYYQADELDRRALIAQKEQLEDILGFNQGEPNEETI